MYDLCIIGGGASGMATAIVAKMNKPELNILILEKNAVVGKKLMATGNGRCNLTNQDCDEFRIALAFFEKIGVLAKSDEEGRFYPYSQEAKEVVKAMDFQMDSLDIEVKLNFNVEGVEKTEDIFVVTGKEAGDVKKIQAEKLVIASGGKAGPEFGTIGDGYRWARSLGHQVTRTAPALAPIKCKEDFTDLKGVRQDARLTLYCSGKVVAIEDGNLQLTKEGLSGICTYNLSRLLEVAPDETLEEGLGKYRIYVDFMPEMDDRQVVELLTERQQMAGAKGMELFRCLVKEPIALDIFKRAGLDPNSEARRFSTNDIEKLGFLTKNWQCNVKSVEGWKHAQVTKGGVELEEINLWTMESNLVENLFFTGEVIDYDGPCGGFNLQNAWETAIKAGEYIAGV